MIQIGILPKCKIFNYQFSFRTAHPCFFDKHCGIERIILYDNINVNQFKIVPKIYRFFRNRFRKCSLRRGMQIVHLFCQIVPEYKNPKGFAFEDHKIYNLGKEDSYQ